MLRFEVNINAVLMVAYAAAMLGLVCLMGYTMVPIIYMQAGIGYSIGAIVLLVFAYLSYLAGLAKELRFNRRVQ